MFPVDLIAYQWMKNHWHMVLSPPVDGGMSTFIGWITLTHTRSGITHIMGRQVAVTSIKAGTRVSPFKMTITSMLSVATSSAMR